MAMAMLAAMSTVLLMTLQVLTGSPATVPDIHILNVREALASTRNQASDHIMDVQSTSNTDNSEDFEETKYWKLKLLHRDMVIPHNFSSHSHRLKELIRRDHTRVAALTHRLTRATYRLDDQDFGSEVVSGMDEGSGEFFVRIGFGSPARSQYMVIDSGSDVVWVQCQPCSQCYRQYDPVFDPSESATFAGVACDSSVCGRLDNARCKAGRCWYEVAYGDGSYTKGSLALETLTFGLTEVRNVAIGCGHRNSGLFVGAAGLLGLGGGSLSFVGQLGGQTGGAFGYCLVSRGGPSPSSGWLVFGRGALPLGAAWVPLLRNPQAPSFYYVGLSGLMVGGQPVPVGEEVFRLTELGNGGVVMDTGTAVTRLPGVAYEALRDAFVAATVGLPRAEGLSIFDTCYDLSGLETVRVPTVSLLFSGGPVLTLPARNFLIPVDEVGRFCLAIAASATELSIIGNIQQEGIQISVDGANGFVGFGPNTC